MHNYNRRQTTDPKPARLQQCQPRPKVNKLQDRRPLCGYSRPARCQPLHSWSSCDRPGSTQSTRDSSSQARQRPQLVWDCFSNQGVSAPGHLRHTAPDISQNVAIKFPSMTPVALHAKHNFFRPQSLLVEGLLSTGPTQSSFYLLVEIGLPLHLFSAYRWWELVQLFIKWHHQKCLKLTKLYLGPI